MKVSLFKSGSRAGRSKPPKPSKPAARPSIRGKISGPIPIPNPLHDDEFPIRNPGTSFVCAKPPSGDNLSVQAPGAALASPAPLDTPEPPAELQSLQTIEAQEPLEPHASTSAVSGSHAAHVGQSSVPPEPAEPPPPPPTQPQAAPLPQPGPSPTSIRSTAQTSPSQRRANPPSTLRYSQASAASTGDTGRSSGGPPQRKKSTLRNALSRLFGRRPKTGSQTSVDMEQVSGLASPQPHRSVSGISSFTGVSPQTLRLAALAVISYVHHFERSEVGGLGGNPQERRQGRYS